MEILITGCERSGTKMLAGKIIEERGILSHAMEPKHTVASFRYWQELQLWKNYQLHAIPIQPEHYLEKHSLNGEQNIDFLRWCVATFQPREIHYIVRDPRAVVASMIGREWGHTQTGGVYRMSLEAAIRQILLVCVNTWEWAQENAVIHRYEDYTDIQSHELTPEQKAIVELQLSDILKLLNY